MIFQKTRKVPILKNLSPQTKKIKKQLYEIRKHKLEGVMLRSRCRYEDLGEKPTSYFLNLEKRSFTNKVITKIIDDNKEYTSTEEILNSQTMYFKTLYSENINIDNNPIETILGENQSKLSHQDANILEGEIKYPELAEALKNMKNSKTPGNDGFTAEFFKFFWIDLKMFILNSLKLWIQNRIIINYTKTRHNNMSSKTK